MLFDSREHESLLSVAFTFATLGLVSACSPDPEDSGNENAATDTAAESTEESSDTTATTGVGTECDADVCEIDPSMCSGPPSVVPGTSAPGFAVVRSLVYVAIIPEQDCPNTIVFAEADPAGNGLANLAQGTLFTRTWYPTDEMGNIVSPPGGLDLFVFSHGNGQSGIAYDDLMRPIVSRGLIAISVAGDPNVGGPLRAHRLMCMAEAVLDGHIDPSWEGFGQPLSGRLAFGGHSQGGRGVFFWAVKHASEGNFQTVNPYDLVGALAVAPAEEPGDNQITSTTSSPMFLILQASGDGDTSGKAFSIYDKILATENAGFSVAAMPKALVWAYGVRHSEWGGQESADPGCQPTAKSIQLMETYIGDWVEVSFYEDIEAASTFFDATEATPKLSTGVAIPELWPDFGGAAQVYGTSSHLVDPVRDYASWTVDRFENADLAMSDSNLEVEYSFTNFAEQPNGGLGALNNSHVTTVALAELTQDLAGNFPDSIDWCLSCDAREALTAGTSLTFRIGFERDFDENECVGESYPLPQIRLVLETDQGAMDVDIAPYVRLALPDTRIETDICIGRGDACQIFSSMQATVRVPLSAFCESGISLDSVTHIRLEFSSPNPVGNDGFGTLVIFDDFEIRRVPGEPEVPCRCG